MNFRLPLFCFSALVLLISVLTLGSCKKPVIYSKGKLEFSADTILFDTVFTTVGSTTRQFKIYNREKQAVIIEQVELMGGTASPFRINVDGVSGTFFNEIELRGEDSLYLFAEVTLDPNGGVLPLVVEDSVRFRTNGKDQYVKLVVWGQDAYIHYLDENDGVWKADKPHLVYDRAYVLENQSLTIEAGAKVYLHKNSILFVKKGRLTINGTLDNEVVFQGDRLESMYQNVSGQWYGIYLDSCLSSTINYAIIKNGTAGIHVTGHNPVNGSAYSVTVNNTKIYNHASYGVFLYAGARFKMENSFSANNGRNALLVLVGADININHCDLLGYNTSGEEHYALAFKNYYNQDGSTYLGSLNECKVYNTVIHGYQEYELVFDTINPGNVATFNPDFRNCLIKSKTIPTSSAYSQVIWNGTPAFVDVSVNDFHIYSSSPMNGTADPTFLIPFDIDGVLRSVTAPDIGAYESN